MNSEMSRRGACIFIGSLAGLAVGVAAFLIFIWLSVGHKLEPDRTIEIVFSGMLVLATATYAFLTHRFVGTSKAQQRIQERQQAIQSDLVAIERERERIHSDPELGVDGRWRGDAPDENGFSTVTGEVWLYNPGPSPIIITLRDYTFEEPGGGINLYDKESFAEWLGRKKDDNSARIHPIFPPIFLPGYGHKWVQIECHAKGLKQIVFTYCTSAAKSKKKYVDPVNTFQVAQ